MRGSCLSRVHAYLQQITPLAYPGTAGSGPPGEVPESVGGALEADMAPRVGVAAAVAQPDLPRHVIPYATSMCRTL